MPVHAVIGLTMKYHIEFQQVHVATKSVLIDLYTVRFFNATTGLKLSLCVKRAWFIPKVGVVTKISLANLTMLPNHYHLPMPIGSMVQADITCSYCTDHCREHANQLKVNAH